MKTVALVGLPLVAIGLAVSFLPKIHPPQKKTSAHHMSIQDAQALGRRYKAQQDAQIAAYRQRAELEAQRQAQAQIESQQELQASNARTRATQDEVTILENQPSSDSNDGLDLFHGNAPDELDEYVQEYRQLYGMYAAGGDIGSVAVQAGQLLREIIPLAKERGDNVLESKASVALFHLNQMNNLTPL